MARSTQHAHSRFRGGLLTTKEFEAWWRGDDIPGVHATVLLCRAGELVIFNGEVIDGPFAGAGRTDLWLIRRRTKK